MDFDADRIYYSHQNLQQQPGVGEDGANAAETANAAAAGADGRLEDEEERAVDVDALRRHFREFLSECLGYLRYCTIYVASESRVQIRRQLLILVL